MYAYFLYMQVWYMNYIFNLYKLGGDAQVFFYFDSALVVACG